MRSIGGFFFFIACSALVGFSNSAFGERPELFLVTEARIAEIQALVEQPGTSHHEAYQAMQARVNIANPDPFVVAGSFTNYKRAFYAREVAFSYLIEEEQAYADLAYEMLRDIDNADGDASPVGERTPTNGSGLNRSQITMSYALAYNWCYDAWTQEQRDWVLGRIRASLNTWPGHANIGSPWMSNWNGVLGGCRVVTLVASGEWKNRIEQYDEASRVVKSHIGSFGDHGWNQEGNHYLCLSMENALLAVLAMEQIGDSSGVSVVNGKRMHQLFMYSSMFNAGQNALNWGTGGGAYDESGTTNLMMGIVPPSELPYYKWYIDHFRGIDNPADPAYKYEQKHGGAVYFLALYPETTPRANPSGQYPNLWRDSLGGYMMRDGWSGVNDTAVSLWAQTESFTPSWNRRDILHMNVVAHDTQWGRGPGSGDGGIGENYSTLLVNGNAPDPTNAGVLVSDESGTNGGYVVAHSGGSLAAYGANRVTRHLLTDFSGDTDVLSLVDIIDGSEVNTYGWNIFSDALSLATGTESGLTWIQATNSENGAWMRAWAITPGATVDLGPNYFRFNYTVEDIDIRVLCEIGMGTQVPSVPVVVGTGVEAVVTIAGRDFGYDGTAKRLSSSGVTDLRNLSRVGIVATRYNGLAPVSSDFSPSVTDPSFTYAWDMGDGTTYTTQNVSHSFTTDGVYQVTLATSDALGVISRATAVIRVGNRRPVLDWTVPQTVLFPGASMTMDASASTDPDGDALSYEWTMGDGTTYTTPSVTHSWAEGDYFIRVKITDSAGNVDGDVIGISVLDRAPYTNVTYSDLSGIAPVEVTMDASNSVDPEGQALTYQFDFDGNGSIDFTSSDPVQTHTYTTPGVYEPEIWAVDPAGNRTRARGYIQVFDPASVTPPVTPPVGTYGSGLNYGFFLHNEDDHNIPDFTLLTVERTGRIGSFDMNAAQPATSQYALVFEGYIDIPETGVYIFRTNGRGVSELYVAGQFLFREGRLEDYEQTAVYLQEGLHDIRLETSYSDAGPFGNEFPFLNVTWETPSSDGFEAIPQTKLLSDFSVLYPTLKVTPSFDSIYKYVGHPGDVFYFEATMPSPDGQPLQYHWDFGDGTTANTRTVAKSFDLPDHMLMKWYRVRLTITDSTGATGVAGQEVRISPYAYTHGKPMDNREKDGEFSVAQMSGQYQQWDRRTDTSRAYGDAINKAREGGTIFKAHGTLSSDGGSVSHLNDGNFGSRWLDEYSETAGAGPFQTWLQVTFQKDGVLQPYNITGFNYTVSAFPWTWQADAKEIDIYVSNAAEPAEWDFTEGAANADWALLEEVRDPRMDYQALAILNDNLPKENKVIRNGNTHYNLTNTGAYAHYLFVLRNQGPQIGYYRLEVNELQLFDWHDYVEPGNTAPIAALSAPITVAETPFTVDFDASATTDVDGDALYYEWDFGDGHTSRRTEDLTHISHTYRDAGVYPVTVTVYDGHGLSDTATVNITVQPQTVNTPPVVDLQVSQTTAFAGTLIRYDASGSTDNEGDALFYEWQFGNGQTSTEPALDFAFTRDGVYNVLLRVTDSRGLSSFATVEITSLHPNEGRPVISMNFANLGAGGYMAPSIGAGIVSTGVWNTFLPPNQKETFDVVFLDSHGETTPLTMDPSPYRTGNRTSGSVSVFEGNAFMFKHNGTGNSRAAWNFWIDNIPYPIYDLYIYLSGPDQDQASGHKTSVTYDGQTIWADTSTAYEGWQGEFVRATATSAAESTVGNYVLFENVSDINPTIWIGGSTERFRIAGLQIVDKSAPGLPFILAQPQPVGVVEGDSVTFETQFYSNPEGTIQWFKGSDPISGATSSIYSFTPDLSDHNGQISAQITNSFGTTTTDSVLLEVISSAEAQAPSFTSISGDQDVDENTEVTLTAVVAGNPTPNIQWRRNGNDITGATGLSYTFTASLGMDGDTITAVATNVVGSVTSDPVNLSVSLADYLPVITQQPVSFSVRENRNATFTVAAHGRPSPTYQWRKDGVDIPGATSAEYTRLISYAEDHNASFDCVVSNSEGSVVSDAAVISVTQAGPPAVDGYLSVNLEFANDSEDDLAPLTSVGVVPLQYWNNIDVLQSGTIGGLFTSIDADSPVQMSMSGSLRTGQANPSASDEDKILGSSKGGSGDSTLTLSNLLAAYPNGFHLIVYGRASSYDRVRNYSLDVADTATYYVRGGTGAFDGEWTRAQSTAFSGANDGEYVQWNHVPAVDTVTVTSAAGSGRSTIAGFQILPASYDLPSAPSVSLTAPAQGAEIDQGANVTLSASALDDGTVVQVEFFVDGNSVGVDSDAGDGWSINWTADTLGNFEISAVATDNDGYSSTSVVRAITVVVPNDPPTVSLLTPVDGASYLVNNTVSLGAIATDDSAVMQVEFFVDGSSVGVDSDGTDGWTSSWDASSAGNFSLTAVATDDLGESTTSAIHLVTINIPGVTIVWQENFEDLSNGATADSGDTAWSLNNTNGRLRHENGAMRGVNLDAVFVWTSESIDISAGTARFSVDLSSAPTNNLEAPDFLKVSYRIDGGDLVTAVEYIDKTSPIGDEWITFEQTGLSGSSLEVVISLQNSSGNENYYFDNVTVRVEENSSVEYTESIFDNWQQNLPQGVTVDTTRKGFAHRANGRLANGLIYALGIDSLDPAAAADKLPKHRLREETGKQYLEFDLRRRRGGNGAIYESSGYTVDGVTYVVECSETLGADDWHSGASLMNLVETIDNGDGTETVTIRLLDSAENSPTGRAFIRLRVQEAQ